MSERLDNVLQRIRELRPDRTMPIHPASLREALREAREPHWTAEERIQIYVALKRASAGDASYVRLIQSRIDALAEPATTESPLRRVPGARPGADWRPWWFGNPDERYWLEITAREIIGGDLQGYCLDEGGKTSQAYTLASDHAHPGDIVYHYDTRVGAIVMKSTISGECELEDHVDPEDDYWILPLTDAREITPPVTRAMMAKREKTLYPILKGIRETHQPPTYLPWAVIQGEIRIRETYLAKMPKAVVRVLALP